MPSKSRGSRKEPKTRFEKARAARPARDPVPVDSYGGDDPWWRRPSTSMVMALITGLAVGFTVGREWDGGSGTTKPTDEAAETPSGSDTGIEGVDKVYASVDEFPSGWIKEIPRDLGKDLNAKQKVAALQALHERDCECGCAFGTLANCLEKDPNCPRSPQLGRLAVNLAKQGKSLKEIIDAVDAEQAKMNAGKQQQPAAQPPPPSGRQAIEVAAYSPSLGPKNAKVTLIEFSDFQ